MKLNFSILKLLKKILIYHMHNIKTNFDKILEVLKSPLKDSVDNLGNFPKVDRKPMFS